MRGSSLWVALCVGVAGALAMLALYDREISPAFSQEALRPANSFARITDVRTRSIALFEEAGKVLQHPRCVNCHPSTERPRQTDSRRLHLPLVVRGADGHGAPGMRCTTCHHSDNFDSAGIPGNEHWGLAPQSMAWEGRSLGQICEQLKDPARTGNRDLAAILKHVVTDSLVIWAWSPGRGRNPAPGTNAQFGELLRGWAESGAHCPTP